MIYCNWIPAFQIYSSNSFLANEIDIYLLIKISLHIVNEFRMNNRDLNISPSMRSMLCCKTNSLQIIANSHKLEYGPSPCYIWQNYTLEQKFSFHMCMIYQYVMKLQQPVRESFRVVYEVYNFSTPSNDTNSYAYGN